ncbi:hypothetical protein F4859DRAFT_289889 [Xylaria cf. heliscus]|nr:hypothetical protein F4859DRAFT_289889 [Xylaria cf. heliscus]
MTAVLNNSSSSALVRGCRVASKSQIPNPPKNPPPQTFIFRRKPVDPHATRCPIPNHLFDPYHRESAPVILLLLLQLLLASGHPHSLAQKTRPRTPPNTSTLHLRERLPQFRVSLSRTGTSPGASKIAVYLVGSWELQAAAQRQRGIAVALFISITLSASADTPVIQALVRHFFFSPSRYVITSLLPTLPPTLPAQIEWLLMPKAHSLN